MTPQEIKEACEKLWNGELLYSGNIAGFNEGPNTIHPFAGKACGEYVSKEARKWRSQFAMYNKGLKASIQASAAEIRREDDSQLVHYVFRSEPKQPEPVAQEAIEQAPEPVETVLATRKPRAPKPAPVKPASPSRGYRDRLTAMFLQASFA